MEHTDIPNSVLDNIGEAIIVVDTKMKVRYQNPAAERMFGDRIIEAPIDDWPKILGLIDPNSGVEIPASGIPIMEALKGRSTGSVRVVLSDPKDPEGTLVSMRATPLRGGKGELSGAILVVRTKERGKVSRKEFEESYERFRFMFDHAPDAYIVLNKEGRVVDMNMATERISGAKRAELIGRPFVDHGTIPEDQLEGATAFFSEVITGNTVGPVPMDILRRDGERRTIEITAHPIIFKGTELILVLARDVSERKAFERALDESEQKFRLISESRIIGIIIMQGFTVRFANQAVADLIDGTLDDLVGKDLSYFIKYIDEEDLEWMMELVQKRLAGDEDAGKEYTCRLYSKTGHLKMVDIRSQVMDMEGEKALFITMVDVTEKKRMNDALKQSEEMFRLMSESSFLGVIIVQDDEVRYLNQAVSDIVDIKIEDFVGIPMRDFIEFIHPEDRQFAIEQMRKKLSMDEGAIRHYPIRLLDRDGNVKWVDLYSKGVEMEGRMADFITMVDITEKRKYEEALKQSEEKYKQLFHSSPEAILLFDMEGAIIDCNEPATMLTNSSREELVGGTFSSFAQNINEDQIEGVMSVFQDILNDRPVDPFEIMVTMNKTGEKRWFEVFGKMLRKGGEPYAILAIARDATSRHEAKEREEAMRAVQETARMKDTFLANMSHELRTPLNAIVGYTEVMLDELFGELNEKQKSQMGKIETSSSHLLALINDILDISKIEAGRLNIKKAPFDIRFTVKKVRDESLDIIRAKAHSVKLVMPDEMPYVHSDEMRVRQVLTNLLTNAVKFTPGGGEISMEVDFNETGFILSVTDNGPGMKPEDIEHVFDSFWQADSGITKEHQGAGLGLSISRMLVERIGGRIWVDTDVEKGTCIRFTIPREEAPSSKDPQ